MNSFMNSVVGEIISESKVFCQIEVLRANLDDLLINTLWDNIEYFNLADMTYRQLTGEENETS